jgi:hypothetical protein
MEYTEKQVKDLFCKTYDIGENEVKVLESTGKTFSVEIEGQTFSYTYTVENGIIRFKPAG